LHEHFQARRLWGDIQLFPLVGYDERAALGREWISIMRPAVYLGSLFSASELKINKFASLSTTRNEVNIPEHTTPSKYGVGNF